MLEYRMLPAGDMALVVEFGDRIERTARQAGHCRVQSATGDEQQRVTRTGFFVVDTNRASFVKVAGLLGEYLRCCG